MPCRWPNVLIRLWKRMHRYDVKLRMIWNKWGSCLVGVFFWNYRKIQIFRHLIKSLSVTQRSQWHSSVLVGWSMVPFSRSTTYLWWGKPAFLRFVDLFGGCIGTIMLRKITSASFTSILGRGNHGLPCQWFTALGKNAITWITSKCLQLFESDFWKSFWVFGYFVYCSFIFIN